MATSGDIAGLPTVEDIITDALRKLGVIRKSEAPKAADAMNAMSELNDMLKEWQADGINLWRETAGTITFAAAEATKDLTPRAMDVGEARVVLTGGSERPLERWEYGQYIGLPNKTAPGQPTCFVPRKTRTTYSLTLWPVPTVSTVVNYTYARVTEDTNALTDQVDYPQEWMSTIKTNLAARLAPGFGLVSTPEAVLLIREASRLYNILRAADRPASYQMGGVYGLPAY